ncbi:MAG: GNAT family N-acetyltransferase [Lachnospiraceae bacterium]|nr:GNAT family N-acetyltransferase [Lachnospiraceae bacterium]
MERKIETERLILRTVTVDDAEAVFQWASDPDVNTYLIYMPHKSVEETRAWLSSRDVNGKDEFDLGFVLKETGELVGMGGLFYHEDLDAWSVGYNLRKDCWGQGLVPEAMWAIIDCVAKEKGIRAVVGEFAKENTKSKRVMEKLGMVYWKDGQYKKADGSVVFESCKYIRRFDTAE